MRQWFIVPVSQHQRRESEFARLTDDAACNASGTVLPRHTRHAFGRSQEFPQSQKKDQHPHPRFGQDRGAWRTNKYTCPRLDLKYAFAREQGVSLQAITAGGQRVLHEWEPFSPCEPVSAPRSITVAIASARGRHRLAWSAEKIACLCIHRTEVRPGSGWLAD